MGVELHVLVEIYVHAVTVARQVIACKVNEHHVLGILLGVIAQEFCILTILLRIACALGGAGNRVYESRVLFLTVGIDACLYTAMGLG